MRFLADESGDFAIVRALRSAGHDVTAVAQQHRGATDDAVLDLADREGRILLTEDKDFGQMSYTRGDGARSVILIRFPVQLRGSLR